MAETEISGATSDVHSFQVTYKYIDAPISVKIFNLSISAPVVSNFDGVLYEGHFCP